MITEQLLTGEIVQPDYKRLPGTCFCSVCQATFQLVSETAEHTSHKMQHEELDRAFQQLCHNCFRCQRSSCPQCWNPVHQVCADCGKQALLPFCLPVPSLEGLVISASQDTDISAPAFLCLRNGRFSLPTHTFAETGPQDRFVEHSPYAETFAGSSTTTTEASSQLDSSYPAWLQEVMGHSPAQLASPRRSIALLPERVVIEEEDLPVAWIQESHALFASSQPSISPDVLKPENQVRTRDLSLVDQVEDALIVLVSSLLLIITLLIVLAIISADMNDLFSHLFHVDFRAEIAYLFQLIPH